MGFRVLVVVLVELCLRMGGSIYPSRRRGQLPENRHGFDQIHLEMMICGN